MANELFQARIPDGLAEEVNDYREERHMSKSETVRQGLRELVEQGEAEEGDDVEADVEAEEKAGAEAVPDGGFLTREEHPWVEPLIRTADSFFMFGIYSFLLGLLAITIPGGAMEWYGAELTDATTAIFLSVFTHLGLFGLLSLLTSGLSLLALEFLMDPREAPIRQYLPETWPDAEPDTPEVNS